MKTFSEMVVAATVDGKVKYPLDCGCKGDHYYAKCGFHQQEYHEDQARKMGIVDLQYNGNLIDTDQGRDLIFSDIRKRMALHPS